MPLPVIAGRARPSASRSTAAWGWWPGTS